MVVIDVYRARVNPCLHLALLEGSYDSDLVDQVRNLAPADLKVRYAELVAEEVPEGADEARWPDDADLRDALPEGADDTIRTLAGIENHSGLRLVHFPDSQVDDLSPLAALPELELLWLGVTPEADLTPLLSCGRLLRVHVDCDKALSDGADEVLKALRTRGVQVDNLLAYAWSAAAPFEDPILKLAVLDALPIELPAAHFFDEFCKRGPITDLA